jgi:hypothetical protein
MKFFKFKNLDKREKWAKVRAKGFARFFVVRGLVLGAKFTILYYLLEKFMQFAFNIETWNSYLISRIIGGIFYGSFMALIIWSINEKAFKESKSEDNF